MICLAMVFHMLQTGQHRQWLAARNLWDQGATTPDEAVLAYCLTYLALRPGQVPPEVVIYLAEHHPLLRGFADTFV